MNRYEIVTAVAIGLVLLLLMGIAGGVDQEGQTTVPIERNK